RPVPEWTLTATVGVTTVRLLEFTDPFTLHNYNNNRAPYAPAYDAHLGATYHSRLGWFGAAEVASTGKTFYDESENPLFAVDPHTVVSARVGYEASHWRVNLFGENLGEEEYYTLIIPGVRHGAPAAPRT